jgi:hypothetical protein
MWVFRTKERNFEYVIREAQTKEQYVLCAFPVYLDDKRSSAAMSALTASSGQSTEVVIIRVRELGNE